MRRPCARCGLEFVGRRASAMYCSGACKQAAWRERVDDGESDASSSPSPARAVWADSGAGLVAEAVEASAHSGLRALALWLAEVLDELPAAARPVHGPRVAAQLTAVLKSLRAQEAAARPAETQLDRLRAAHAETSGRYGR